MLQAFLLSRLLQSLRQPENTGEIDGFGFVKLKKVYQQRNC
jgi:hypothetical protein